MIGLITLVWFAVGKGKKRSWTVGINSYFIGNER
jgi:hypothetical protein